MFDFALHLRFLQKATDAFFEMGQASVAAGLAYQSRIHDELTSSVDRPTTPAFPAWPTAWPMAFSAAPFSAQGFAGSGFAAPNPTTSGYWATSPKPDSRPPTPALYSPWQMWLDCWMPSVPEPVTPEPAQWSTNPMSSWLAAIEAWQAWASPETFPRVGAPSAATPSTSGFGAAIPGWPMFAATANFWGMSPWSFYQGPLTAMMLSYGVPYAVAAPTARASTSAMDAADCACTQWRLVFGSNNERSVSEWPLATRQSSAARWPAYTL